MRKPHSDSTLKTLPEDQQQQIITWLKTGSLAQTLQHVREEFKIRTSRSALSRFYHWWHIANPLDHLNRSLLVLLDHEPDLSQLPVKIEQICQVALARLLEQAHTQEDPALLRHVIQMHIALGKSHRDQAKFEAESRTKQYAFLQQIETAQANAREQTKFNQDLDRSESERAKFNELWRESHSPASSSPSSSPTSPTIQPSTIHHPPTPPSPDPPSTPVASSPSTPDPRSSSSSTPPSPPRKRSKNHQSPSSSDLSSALSDALVASATNPDSTSPPSSEAPRPPAAPPSTPTLVPLYRTRHAFRIPHHPPLATSHLPLATRHSINNPRPTVSHLFPRFSRRLSQRSSQVYL